MNKRPPSQPPTKAHIHTFAFSVPQNTDERRSALWLFTKPRSSKTAKRLVRETKPTATTAKIPNTDLRHHPREIWSGHQSMPKMQGALSGGVPFGAGGHAL